MSLKIGELGVLPKMRAAPPATLLAACGTSCRHQIADVAGREARHIVRLLDEASAPSSIRFSRRIGRIFWYVRVHVIPWLGAFDEDIRVRPEPARIVEARDADADQIRPGRNLNVKRCAAIAAKYAGDFIAGVGSSDVTSGLALDDTKGCGWDPNRSDKGAAALPLAIPAMALQRKNGFSGAFIADRTAQAPTGPQVCHTRLRRGLRCRIALVLSLRAK